LIRLAPHDADTDEFLSGGNGWPPDAFAVTRDVRAALRSLPANRHCSPRQAAIVPFPALLNGGATDYAGRGILESLEAVRAITGLPLPFDREGSLGREFWATLLRGGYQGAAYTLEK
jgi:hypothetical protein